MKKLLSEVKKISEKIYDEVGCEKEEHIQIALSIELDKLKISHLRETSIQIYYEKHPIGILELDFLISPWEDLNEYIIFELKLSSKIGNSDRQQLKNQLRSAPFNNHELIKKVTKGVIINFKKEEKYKEGKNEIPQDKVEIEVWEYKKGKFEQRQYE